MNDEPLEYNKNVDTKLIIRQRIFFVIIFILVTLSSANVIEKDISPILAIGGFILAVGIGLILSRMFKIFWHQKKEKVVSELDTIGTLLLIIYIVIEIERDKIFGYWLSGPALAAFGLIILTGLLCGRFIGTHVKIKEVLNEEIHNQ